MKKNAKIRACSYAKRKDGSLIAIEDLHYEERQAFATKATLAFMNELYAGKAKFFDCSSAPSGAVHAP